MNYEIYHALAGTGKTTQLINLLHQEIQNGTPVERIAVIAFSKVAASVVKDRVSQRFGIPPTSKSLEHFRTLHSMCYRALKINPYHVMDKEKFQTFGELTDFGARWSTMTEELDWKTSGDHKIMLLDQVYRNNRAYATTMLDHAPDIVASRLSTFMALYARYRRERHYVDFTDMLQHYLNRKLVQDVDVAFIDEAQDLTPLQWQVAFQAFRQCRTLYIAGDSNQGIYRFAGADPDILTNLRGNLHYLSQSYRVPRQVLAVAQKCLRQIKHRVQMDWYPTKAEGKVRYIVNWAEMPTIKSGQTYFFLSRNRKFLAEFRTWCHENAYPYYFNKVPVFSDAEKIAWREGRTAGWPPDRLDFARRCDRAGRFYPDPQITIATIHCVKGDEADVVVLRTDMSPASYDAFEYDPETEHRTFFVGVTRAKKELYIMEAQSKHAYTYLW